MNGKLRNMASVYISSQGKMLMLYRIGSRVVPPSWCGIGGHFEKDELNDAKACMLRELQEEIGLTESSLKHIELRYITLRLKNSEVRQNYFFFAELREGTEVKLKSKEGKPQWVEFDRLFDLDMPFSAKYVLEHYMTVGIYTDTLYSGSATEDNVVFMELKEF